MRDLKKKKKISAFCHNGPSISLDSSFTKPITGVYNPDQVMSITTLWAPVDTFQFKLAPVQTHTMEVNSLFSSTDFDSQFELDAKVFLLPNLVSSKLHPSSVMPQE